MLEAGSALFCQTGPPAFANRALRRPAVHAGDSMPTVAGDDEVALNKELESVYGQIDPEKSLFIRNCHDWCSDKAFSFQTQIQRAAAIASPGNTAATEHYWITSFGSTVTGFQNNLLDQLELAAVVNRLDLATLNGDQWENAELRFVYAAKDPKVDFGMTLEFGLPSMDSPALRGVGKSMVRAFTLERAKFPGSA